MNARAATAKRPTHALRRAPEWIVFGVSALVLLAIIVALIVLAFQGSDPAAPVAETPGAVRHVGEQFLVPVEIVNEGDESAAQVQVQAELTIGGTTTAADQVIDFLGRGERRQLTFVFEDDPGGGELAVGVVSFAEP
jgi:uncharacterized protein (TIGR02588 family)